MTFAILYDNATCKHLDSSISCLFMNIRLNVCSTLIVKCSIPEMILTMTFVQTEAMFFHAYRFVKPGIDKDFRQCVQ